MDYMARRVERRADPRIVLPGAKSIVVVAMNYAPGEPESGSRSGTSGSKASTGFIARYARGPDYHELIGEKLNQLSARVCELGGPGTATKSYVDTGPVLERDLAQRAGIGWIGKHTNLLSRRFGNWFFLGEILTTLELEPDAPEREYCGTCTRCIAVCPTQAIRAPYVLDARRCISYLTIELKGSIPTELRPLIGNRIFGCDDCLAVCPWNRFARQASTLQFDREDLRRPDLIELMGLTEPQFRARFGGTPIARIKRRGLLRNVAVALGNARDRAAVPALEKALDDPEPLIREHARWALEVIRERERA
jgi:epoxyqueuosine reductase